MTLKEILAISGQQGLFKLVASSKSGIIVESLDSGKRMSVPTTTKASSLEDIAIFTLSEDKPLYEILIAIKEKQQSQQAISHKSEPEAIKQFFAEVVPEFDPARVYFSDMKKIINWYNILQAKDMLDIIKPSEETKAVTEETVEETDIEKDVE